MNLKLKPGRGSRVIAGVVFLCSLATPAHAQLTAIVNCATSNFYGQTGESCGQTVAVYPGPPTEVGHTTLIPGETITRELSGSGPATSFSTSASARANYGSVGIAGTASLTGQAVPYYETGGTRTRQVVANSTASWRDQVTFSGAPGSFVDVLVSHVIDIHFFDTTATEYGDAGGAITFSSTYAPGGGNPWCYGSIAAFCGPPSNYSALTLGTNLLSFTTQMAVGGPITVGADLVGAIFATGTSGGYASDASTAYDALNTARTYFTVLTDGATMSWASGHDYSAPVAVTPVPEPSTCALMLAGLGLVGWIARKRKATQATAA